MGTVAAAGLPKTLFYLQHSSGGQEKTYCERYVAAMAHSFITELFLLL